MYGVSGTAIDRIAFRSMRNPSFAFLSPLSRFPRARLSRAHPLPDLGNGPAVCLWCIPLRAAWTRTPHHERPKLLRGRPGTGRAAAPTGCCESESESTKRPKLLYSCRSRLLHWHCSRHCYRTVRQPCAVSGFIPIRIGRIALLRRTQ